MTVSATDLLIDGFDHVHDGVRAAVQNASQQTLAERIDPDANSIAWLIWHLTRVQDDHLCGVAGVDQAWTAQGWSQRFALPLPDSDIGYGHDSDQVALLGHTAGTLLIDYAGAVHAQSVQYLRTLTTADLDRVVDKNFDPPVTLAVRVVSVLNDTLQHAGQAAYARGIIDRRND